MTAKGYDQRADMWSVGVIVYILLGGYAPFEGPVEELANVILRGEYEFHDKYWKYTSSDAKDLITSLLMVNPNLRATAEDALQSDWMTTDAETLTGNDLSVAQEKLRKSLPIQKLKGAVHTVCGALMAHCTCSSILLGTHGSCCACRSSYRTSLTRLATRSPVFSEMPMPSKRSKRIEVVAG